MPSLTTDPVDLATPPSVCPNPRRRLLIAVGMLMFLLGCVLRLMFLLSLDQSVGLIASLAILGLGVINDVFAITVQLTPLALFLALSGGGSLRLPTWRFTVLTLVCAGLLFNAAVEQAFFDEFTSRFNHIALDYLLFPGEVATNIWQSYNVPLFVAIALAVGAGLAWPIHRWLRGAAFAPLPWSQRLAGAGFAVLIGALAGLGAWAIPVQVTDDRARDEVAANGQAQLVRAFTSAHLSYEQFYRTVPAEQARPLVEAEFHRPADQPLRTFTAAVRRDRPFDVVVILEESLGSEFVGRLKGRNPCTPGIDRWSERALLMTNLVATGNRTVRGLEGVLCSFMPLPGDSVWKRNKSEDVATLAEVLDNKGYQTEFFYGGAGIFDGMKPFALNNGWDAFVEDGLIGSDFPPDAFRTAWGAADGYVFDRLLAHQRKAHATGVPFFGTLLTTSNHKPFLTPNTRGVQMSSAKVLRWGGIGAGLLVAAILIFVLFGRRLGRLRVALVAGVILLGYGIWMNVKIQPSDTRENAVRYSDQALANYLDHAEAEGMLEHTVYLVVGDHGARVYGSAEIPAASYRIPALFLAPEQKFHGVTIDRLSSQIDLAPTLLSLAGVDYRAPFLGHDLLGPATEQTDRAWLIHNRTIGLLTDRTLVTLGLRKSVTWFRRSGRDSDIFTLAPEDTLTAEERALADRAAAAFQEASGLYENRRFHLEPAP